MDSLLLTFWQQESEGSKYVPRRLKLAMNAPLSTNPPPPLKDDKTFAISSHCQQIAKGWRHGQYSTLFEPSLHITKKLKLA